MVRFFWAFVLANLAMSAWASLARADSWNACSSSERDVSISGCSTIIDAGTETQSNLSVAYYNHGLAYQYKGQPDGAITDYDMAIALDPKFAHAYFNRGLANEKLGKLENAKADFQKALEPLPNNKMAIEAFQRLNARN